jgi:hypothetical protein
MSRLIWKRGEDWVQYDPPRYHPQYEEWIKHKQKQEEKQNGKRKETDG